MRFLKRGRYKYMVLLLICSIFSWALLAADNTTTTSAEAIPSSIYKDTELPWIFPINIRRNITTTTTTTTDQSIGQSIQPLQLETTSENFVWDDAIHLAGKIRTTTGILTIGIPTVHRPNASYLYTTLRSLINNMSHDERKNVVCVIFLSGSNSTFAGQLARNLTATFPEHLDSGLIRLITASQTYYPSLDKLKITFKDSIERVKWRSRQNLDYAYLVHYSRNISKYYLQIEDDVIVGAQFVGKILEFVKKQKNEWAILDFSGKGFIGKLFKSCDLTKLAMILRVFFNEQPCDFLINYFSGLMLQTKRIMRKPSLFKHIGHFSTLKNQIRKVGNGAFANNPEAWVNSTIEAYEKFTIENVYDGESKFWGKTPLAGDEITILFLGVQNSIKRITIESGDIKKPEMDTIKGAVLEFGKGTNKGCRQYFYMGKFVTGRIDVNSTGIKFIRCLRIRITEDHENWIIISKIQIL